MPATLLLADDSVTIQRVIELTFADEDITVVAVGDGDAAIARLDGAPPDIVLADVDMPGRDGYAVATHVRQTPALAHIPVLLLTGAFDPVDDARARASGCAGVLVKPFEPQMVISRVRELLEHRAPAGTAPTPVAQGGSTAADALLAAPDRRPASPRESVDDYFQRLDEAFAHLNVPPTADQPIDGQVAAQVPVAAAAAPSPRPADPGPAVSAPGDPVASEVAPSVAEAPAGAADSLSMADAFGALLGMERGGAPPVLPEAWLPVPSEEVVEQIARRVSEEVTERVVRQLAPDIVSRVAERLVREELERLKGLQS